MMSLRAFPRAYIGSRITVVNRSKPPANIQECRIHPARSVVGSRADCARAVLATDSVDYALLEFIP